MSILTQIPLTPMFPAPFEDIFLSQLQQTLVGVKKFLKTEITKQLEDFQLDTPTQLAPVE